jgi:hypothetical protein
MAVLATYQSDPNFYQRQLNSIGQGIGAFIGNYRQQQEQQQQNYASDIQQAFKAMQQMPELADTDYANSLITKYGDTHPEVPAIIGVIRQRQQLEKKIPQAGHAWEQGQQGLEDAFSQKQKSLAAMPDMAQVNVPHNELWNSIFGQGGIAAGQAQPGQVPFGQTAPMAPLKAAQNVPVNVPNPEKSALAKEVSDTDTSQFPLKALLAMPVEQRHAAAVYAKSMGISVPDPTLWDPYKMLPEDARLIYATEHGQLDPKSDTAKAGRYKVGLDVSPAEQAKMNQQLTVQDVSLQNSLEKQANADKLERGRMGIADSLKAKQLARTVAAQKGMVDYRAASAAAGGDGDGADSEDDSDVDDIDPKALVTDSAQVVKDYDTGLKQAISGIPIKAQKKAKDAYIAQNGARPVAVPLTVAQQISAAAAKKGLTGPDAADATIAASSAYVNFRRNGDDMPTAFKKSITYVDPAVRKQAAVEKDPTLFANVKDPKVKTWALHEYVARLSAGSSAHDAYGSVMDILRVNKQIPGAIPPGPPTPRDPAFADVSSQ